MLQSTQFSCFTGLRGFPNSFQSDVEQLHVRVIYFVCEDLLYIFVFLFFIHPSNDSIHPSVPSIHPSIDSIHPSIDFMHPSIDSIHPSIDSIHPSIDSTHPLLVYYTRWNTQMSINSSFYTVATFKTSIIKEQVREIK